MKAKKKSKPSSNLSNLVSVIEDAMTPLHRKMLDEVRCGKNKNNVVLAVAVLVTEQSSSSRIVYTDVEFGDGCATENIKDFIESCKAANLLHPGESLEFKEITVAAAV